MSSKRRPNDRKSSQSKDLHLDVRRAARPAGGDVVNCICQSWPCNLIVALAVSTTKAIIIALFFMQIKGSSRLLHLTAVAGVMWLLILISLTLSD